MQCIECGHMLADNDSFCTGCGKKVEFSKALIDRAVQGDDEAQTQIYNETYQSAYTQVRSMVRDEDAALDILQDSYVKAFRSLAQLKEPNKFRAWLKTITHNRTMDYFRERKSLVFSEAVSADAEEVEMEIVDDYPDRQPEVVMDRQETERLIDEILNDLPEEQRAVISMFYYEQQSVEEIAAELGVSKNTVKSRLNYGRKKVESEVRALEKKGTKLYGLAPIPFLLMLFRRMEAQAMETTAEVILERILAATAAGAVTEVGTEKSFSANTIGRVMEMGTRISSKVSSMGGISGLMQYTITKLLVASVALLLVVVTVIGIILSQRTSQSLSESLLRQSQADDADSQTADETEAVSGEIEHGIVGRSGGVILPEVEPVEKIYARLNPEFVESFRSTDNPQTADEWYDYRAVKANVELEIVSYYTGVDAVYIIDKRENVSQTAEEYADTLYRLYDYNENAIVFYYDFGLKDWSLSLKGNVAEKVSEGWLEQTIDKMMSLVGENDSRDEGRLLGEVLQLYFQSIWEGLKAHMHIYPYRRSFILSDNAAVIVGDIDKEQYISAIEAGDEGDEIVFEEGLKEICMGDYLLYGLDGYVTVKDYWGNPLYDIDLREYVATWGDPDKQKDVLKDPQKLQFGNQGVAMDICLPYGSTLEYRGSDPLFLMGGNTFQTPANCNFWEDNYLAYDRWVERLKGGTVSSRTTQTQKADTEVAGITNEHWYPSREEEHISHLHSTETDEERSLYGKTKGYAFAEIYALGAAWLEQEGLVSDIYCFRYGKKEGMIPNTRQNSGSANPTPAHDLRVAWENMKAQTKDPVLMFGFQTDNLTGYNYDRETFAFLLNTVTLEGTMYQGSSNAMGDTYPTEGTPVSFKEELPDWETLMQPRYTPDEAWEILKADVESASGTKGWELTDTCKYIISEDGHVVRCEMYFACEAVKGRGYAEIDLYDLYTYRYDFTWYQGNEMKEYFGDEYLK